MEIELVPDRGPDDPASRAALAALVAEGLASDRLPDGVAGAWRRAGLEDAIDRSAGTAADALRNRPGDGLGPGRRRTGDAESDSASRG